MKNAINQISPLKFVQKSLLENIAPRLKELTRGGYARAYKKRGKLFPSATHVLISEILDSLGVKYRIQEPLVPGSSAAADFAFGDTVILIEKELTRAERKRLRSDGKRCILIARSKKRSALDSGFRVVQLEDEKDARLQTIFLDDPSFNFDYAHILPKTEKCSVMHGHTSSALVEIVGTPIDGMVVDFNDAKPIVRRAIRGLDHKLFINKKYVTSEESKRVKLAFNTIHGKFFLDIPKKTTVLLKGEATVENLAQEILGRIAPGMPENIKAVGVYVYEGLNKGTHLLAEIHRREAEKQRRKR
jgi:6-pyruvoyltetrahydropterin/6-carboxytetrahydropterin synthase